MLSYFCASVLFSITFVIPPFLLKSSLEYANASSSKPNCDSSFNLFITPSEESCVNKDCTAFLYCNVLPDSAAFTIESNKEDRGDSTSFLLFSKKSESISPPVTKLLPILYLVNNG